MPLYEYTCQKCHRDHEVMQRLIDSPLKKCPSCGGKVVKKLSATAFQLKGGGWYKDGYSSKKGCTPSEDNASSKSDSGKPDSGKSDSVKPDSGKTDSGKGNLPKGEPTKTTKEKK